MTRLNLGWLWLLGLWAGGFGSLVGAQTVIPINGVADKQTYTDSVSFTVPAETGFRYSITLNDQALPAGQTVQITEPDFYLLLVLRSPIAGGVTNSRLVRFLVVAGERKGTEWGLPPHVPSPVIPSASTEFGQANLRLLMPSRLPLGLNLPVIAWVEDAAGHARRVNGVLAAEGFPPMWVRRGVGSAVHKVEGPARTLTFQAQLGGLSSARQLELEEVSQWTQARGILASQTEWQDGSRVHLTGNLTVPAGGTLRIGAGSVIQLDPRVDITNNGRILILGTQSDPVLFLPAQPGRPWGGFIMRSGTGMIEGTGVIFSGSGAEPAWFGQNGNPGSHRKEQALFFVNDNQSVHLTHSAAIQLAGQLGHSVKGGSFQLDHFLMQRTTSGGEFTGASFRVTDSAFIECPEDSSTFVDGDNDALYLVSGDHSFERTLFGWTKDDGVDSGGSGTAKLRYQSCWFESTFHEGNSLSGAKDVLTRDGIYLDCGQGIEDGYEAPVGVADHCFFAGNQVGVRHGDNYPNIGAYAGRITATNCLILFNHRDVFGYNWRSSGWTNAVGQMVIRDNWLSQDLPDFPANRAWDPVADGVRLASFGASDRVGVGFGTRGSVALPAELRQGIPVRLSMACTRSVLVHYLWESPDGGSRSDTISLLAGQLGGFIPFPGSWHGLARVTLVSADPAEITGRAQILIQRNEPQNTTSLVPRAAVWSYRDDAVDRGTSWRQTGYDDRAWPQGPAPFGYGDGPEGTTLRATDTGPEPRPFTYYFRHAFEVVDPNAFSELQFGVRRDDGVVVHLNGEPLFQMNMPDLADIKYSTPAASSVSDETSYFSTNLPPTRLISGTNWLAVELHQSSMTSGDAHFDLEVIGAPPAPPLRLRFVQWDGETYLYWEAAPAILLHADTLSGPWEAVPTARSPQLIAPSSRRFYRLGLPTGNPI